MTDAQRRYVRTEMVVGAIINAVLSIVFLFIVFGGQHMVAVEGRGGLIVDAVPQTLMIALMSMLVPTLLTRKRIAAGVIAPLPTETRWPRNVVVRSLLVALVSAVIAWALHAVLMPLTGTYWSFLTVVMFKPTYGALLGATISRLAVMAALRE